MFSTDLFAEKNSNNEETKSFFGKKKTVQLYGNESTKKLAKNLNRSSMCPELTMFKQRFEREFAGFGMEDGRAGIANDPKVTQSTNLEGKDDSDTLMEVERVPAPEIVLEDEDDQQKLLDEFMDYQMNENDDIVQLQSFLGHPGSGTAEETLQSYETKQAKDQFDLKEIVKLAEERVEQDYEETFENNKLDDQVGVYDSVEEGEFDQGEGTTYSKDYKSTLKRLESRFEVIGQGNRRYFFLFWL